MHRSMLRVCVCLNVKDKIKQLSIFDLETGSYWARTHQVGQVGWPAIPVSLLVSASFMLESNMGSRD